MEKRKLLCIIGLVCALLAFAAAMILNMPTVGEKTLSFSAPYGEKNVKLQGSFWEVEGSEYAALICPGYSCDRQKWRPMADLLVANGVTTMSFDYSGQGASGGTIGFDNAKTDRIPEQIDAALTRLHELTGIDYDHIILVGHSMGGRSILRLLYDYNCAAADTRVTKKTVGSAILMAPEVNYEFNAQASLFAGTSDDAEEPWHSYDGSYIAGTDVYLFGSTGDDIVSDRDVLAIYAHLGGSNAPESGVCRASMETESGSRITVNVTGGVLHSYEMYSPTFGRMVNDALTEIRGTESTYPAVKFLCVYLAWIAGLLGIALLLGGLNDGENAVSDVPVLVDSGKFLRRKALLWIPGMIAAFIICSICVVMPFGSPVMNIPYMCFIAGYGFTMAFAYRKGKFPGVEGKLPGLKLGISGDKKPIAVGVAVSIALCLFVWYVLRATMYRLIPLNARLFWVCFAAVMMTVGYYISGCEGDMLKNAPVRVKIVYNLIQYVPLLLLVLFYLVLKSYSGMIGQIQNMILMYVFCVPLGSYLRAKTGSRLIGAVVTGFLFQTLMITSAALIAMF